MNEFKFSALRQFGSENVSLTSTIHSDDPVLTDEEIDKQVALIDKFINKSFRKCNEREIGEKEVLMEFADKRRAGVAKLDAALKEEMVAKVKAEGSMKEAEKLSKKLNK